MREKCGKIRQSECGKIRTRIAPNTGTIYAVGLTRMVLMLGASSMHLAFDKTEFPQVILGSQFRFIGG